MITQVVDSTTIRPVIINLGLVNIIILNRILPRILIAKIVISTIREGHLVVNIKTMAPLKESHLTSHI